MWREEASLWRRTGWRAAVAAAVASAALAPSTSEASHLPFGLGHGVGGVTDPCQVSLTDALCVTFVTHFAKGDGSQVVREHEVLASVDLPLALAPASQVDVTGDGRNDVAVRVSVPLTLDTSSPTIEVTKLATAPTTLPLRIEAVVDEDDNPDRMTSFGYDSRSTTAPRSWVARIQLNPLGCPLGSSCTQVGLMVGGAARSLAIVSDSFVAGAGLGEDQRSDRFVRRIEYAGDPARGTQVPTSASIAFTEGPDERKLSLTRGEPTTVALLVADPLERGGDKLSGTLDRLPSSVSVTIADAAGSGGASEQRIDYVASAPVRDARLDIERLVREGAATPHRQHVAVAVEDLAREVHLTYSADSGRVHYTASTPTTRIELRAEDEVPFFARARSIFMKLLDVPTEVQASYGDGFVLFDAKGGELGLLEFTAQETPQAPLPDGRPCTPLGEGPAGCDDGLGLLRDPELDGLLLEDGPDRYLLLARSRNLKLADVKTKPDVDAYLDTGSETVAVPPDCVPEPDAPCEPREIRRAFDLSLRIPRDEDEEPQELSDLQDLRARIATLEPAMRFRRFTDDTSSAERTTRYIYTDGEASHLGPRDVTIDGFNLPGLPEGSNEVPATELHIDLRSVPRELEFSHAAKPEDAPEDSPGGGFPLRVETVGPSGLGGLDVLLTSGPDERLPADDGNRTLDGLYLRDFADRFVINTRLQGLRRAFVDRSPETPFGGSELDFELDSSTVSALKVDSRKAIERTVSGDVTFEGTENLQATLTPLPRNVDLNVLDTGPQSSIRLKELTYSADNTADFFDLHERTTFPDFEQSNGVQHIRFERMPRTLHICKTGFGPSCTSQIFERFQANQGSVFIDANPRTEFTYLDHPAEGAFATFTRVFLDVRKFALQADDRDDSGYIAIDTDWRPPIEPVDDPPTGFEDHRHPLPPPIDDQLDGYIDKSDSLTHGIRFDFGEEFAADRRFLDFEKGLLDAVTFDIFDSSGHDNCTGGTSIVRRPHPLPGVDELDLTDEFCEEHP
jgi:hypothetical protein